MARKSKYETHVVPRFHDMEKWLKRGASDKEIYKALGVSESSWYEYLQKYTELSEFVKKHRVDAVEEIKCALFKRATGFQYTETKEKTVKDIEGRITKVSENTVKPVVPDVAAALVLLKHWAKHEGWTNDPQTLALKRQEFEHKIKMDEEKW